MASTDTETQARAALRSWVAGKAGLEASAELDAVRLFEDRVLNSLDFIELIMLVERLSQAPVDIDTLTADDVASIDAIVARLLNGAQA